MAKKTDGRGGARPNSGPEARFDGARLAVRLSGAQTARMENLRARWKCKTLSDALRMLIDRAE